MTSEEAHTHASRIMIERATAADAATLSALGTETFVATFGHLYHKEDLDTFLAQAHSEARYATILANPNSAIWLARDSSGQAVGYGVAGRCGLPVKDLEPSAGEIKRLYVKASQQNSGLGTRLMNVMLDWLVAAGRDPLYVGVWSQNYGAQRFYQRYGFERIGEYQFPVGRQLDLEFILRRSRTQNA